MLRFRDVGASCFGLRFRVLRFRNYRAMLYQPGYEVIHVGSWSNCGFYPPVKEMNRQICTYEMISYVELRINE